MPTAWNSFITALIASSVFCSVDGEQAANTITDAATAIKNKEFRDDVNLNNSENLILCRSLKYKNSLYGGRVYLNYNFGQGYGWLEVDGISIKQYNCSTAGKIDSTSTHSLEQIVAHLNQIENLGVDSFLENYKAQLQELKKEFGFE